MTKMKDIIELLQQLKSRKLYEDYVREFDRINIHYFNCQTRLCLHKESIIVNSSFILGKQPTNAS